MLATHVRLYFIATHAHVHAHVHAHAHAHVELCVEVSLMCKVTVPRGPRFQNIAHAPPLSPLLPPLSGTRLVPVLIALHTITSPTSCYTVHKARTHASHATICFTIYGVGRFNIYIRRVRPGQLFPQKIHKISKCEHLPFYIACRFLKVRFIVSPRPVRGSPHETRPHDARITSHEPTMWPTA